MKKTADIFCSRHFFSKKWDTNQCSANSWSIRPSKLPILPPLVQYLLITLFLILSQRVVLPRIVFVENKRAKVMPKLDGAWELENGILMHRLRGICWGEGRRSRQREINNVSCVWLLQDPRLRRKYVSEYYNVNFFDNRSLASLSKVVANWSPCGHHVVAKWLSTSCQRLLRRGENA